VTPGANAREGSQRKIKPRDELLIKIAACSDNDQPSASMPLHFFALCFIF